MCWATRCGVGGTLAAGALQGCLPTVSSLMRTRSKSSAPPSPVRPFLLPLLLPEAPERKHLLAARHSGKRVHFSQFCQNNSKRKEHQSHFTNEESIAGVGGVGHRPGLDRLVPARAYNRRRGPQHVASDTASLPDLSGAAEAPRAQWGSGNMAWPQGPRSRQLPESPPSEPA